MLSRNFSGLRAQIVYLCVATFALSTTTPPVKAVGRQILSEHVPLATTGLLSVGRLSEDRHLNLAVGLPLRHPEILQGFLEDIYNPASPQYHQYLTVAQFTDKFGPTTEDYEAVIAFLRSRGFRIAGTYANRMLVDVDAPVSVIENAFHVTMLVYPHPSEGRSFFAPNAEPSLDLGVPVLHISGLDDFQLPRPAGLRPVPQPGPGDPVPQSGSGPGGSYKGFDFRAAYAPGVLLTGAGQYVGLLQFDGYYPSDIFAYATSAGLTNVPLQNVLLNGVTGIPGASGNNIEVALDIEMSLSMAPGLAGVIVYEGAAGDTILNRMAVDNVAKQLSASWTFGTDATSTQIFQEFAAQGQQYFNAAGDSGAYASSVSSPTDNPYITSVGGTTLSTRGPVQGYISEVTWSWFNSGQGNGASSGGISPTWAIPVWQQGMDMSTNHGSTSRRNLPDVSMVSDNVYVTYGNGLSTSVGGDSVASPLWAGFIALVNQQAALNGLPTVGFINPAVYAIGRSTNYTTCFHDIKLGNNTNSISPTLFYATNGYDLCTGWGSPTGKGLINALAPTPNARVVIGAGTTLTLETCTPTNGAADPGEAVAMSFSLQNVGGINTTSLVATLLSTGGVVAASGPQAYGALTAGGAAVAKSFVFTPTGLCGGTINPTLQLQDGTTNLGNVVFSVSLGAPMYALTQNFDTVVAPALPVGWSSSVTAGMSNWVTVTPFRQTPPNSASAVGAAIPGVSELYSPFFPITSPAAQLSFRNSYVTELSQTVATDGFDGGLLEISIAGGAFADILTAGGSFVTGGYNATIDGTTGNPLGGRQAWAGTSGGFILTTVNLPASAAGQTVRLKWRLATDTGNTAGNTTWCIDTLVVTDGTACCIPATNADLAISQTVSPDPALVGQAVVYNFSATNLGPAAATSITVTDTLPDNVTFAAASAGFVSVGGTVVGTFPLLTSGGRTNFFITVTPNAGGPLTNSVTLSSSVNDSNTANSSSTIISMVASPLTITTQPSNQIAIVGADTGFSVTAAGTPPLTYQWSFGGVDQGGATDATLLLTNVQPSQAGTYQVVVTDASGSITSAPASLTVLVPSTISLTSLDVSPTNVAVSVTSITGLTYTLEYKDSLTDPAWIPLLPSQPGTGGTIQLQDTNGAVLPSRFYRVNTY